ncbi:MAG: hypothetical protein A3J06_00820 [Candidatus Moranbacteria bacterium RIFCSPLOWO2_02_FULL_48_19]|nr:MAG: hypothetical protein A3J06_00820 [Candidatus Moranbacteria bacterium RIFCSPLOWO2_02_FULL_48_19]OGI31501.1 MAG: hypothetical protein A3G09_03870 [Candidatus Moranbacteria bacterium RIFCSPLOWO2_12_FULL_48_12]
MRILRSDVFRYLLGYIDVSPSTHISSAIYFFTVFLQKRFFFISYLYYLGLYKKQLPHFLN